MNQQDFIRVFFFSVCLLSGGCATVPDKSALEVYNKQIEAKQEVNQKKIDDYFKSPNNDILILIKGMPGTSFARCTIMIMGGTNFKSQNNTFETQLPLIQKLPTGKVVDGIIKSYKAITDSNQQKVYLENTTIMPTMSIVCQDTVGGSGLQGAIYFNGQEYSSDVANVEYATISLSFTAPLRNILKDVK